jgi:glycosyltransferase involved in cell wall biosynthesis
MQTLLLANEFARRKIETHIILHRAQGEFLDEVNGAVQIHDLGIESHALIPVIALKLSHLLSTFPDGLVIVKLWSSILAVQLAMRLQNQLTFAIYEDLDPLEHWQFIKLGRLKKKIIRPIFRHSPLILANTERVADSMQEAYSLDNRPPVLYCGIDVSRIRALAESTSHIPLDDHSQVPIKIVTVASLRRRKGHPRILAALCEIDQPWRWDIVGDGPDAEAFRNQIPSEMAGQIFFHGAVSNPYPYIHAADALVHLPYSEAFGIVILEALALGTPVISSPCIGPREISTKIDPHNRYIRFVEPTDPHTVSEAIGALSTSPTGQIPSSIADQFTITKAADSWLSLAETAAESLGWLS